MSNSFRFYVNHWKWGCNPEIYVVLLKFKDPPKSCSYLSQIQENNKKSVFNMRLRNYALYLSICNIIHTGLGNTY